LFPSTIMIPAYMRVRTMGVGLHEIHHEYMLLLIQMCCYFCTAAVALYVSALHHAKQAAKKSPIS